MTGWHRPRLGGWARVALLLLTGLVLAVAAVGGGAVFATFAVAPLAQAVAVWPRHRGTPRHEGGALALTFSRPWLVARIVTWVAF